MAAKVLLVEDDRALREALSDTLLLGGHEFVAVDSAEAALPVLAREAFSLVISDVNMPGMDGHQLLGLIRTRYPHLPVLLMTAYGAVDRAVEAMRQGAADYLVKPFEARALLDLVARHALGQLPGSEEDGPVALEPASRQLLELAARVARSDSTVLISGESGTGKEVLANYIHQQSPRAGKPFIAINCAAIPDNMLEATLFGHEKGSFTGAIAAQPGKFELADGGTILLDEISEMPLGLQAKLLRVLQEREVERVGARKPINLDIRAFPRGPLLSPVGLPAGLAAAARTPCGHPAAGRASAAQAQPQDEPRRGGARPRGRPVPGPACLAGQRTGTRQRHPACVDPATGRPDPARRPVPHRADRHAARGPGAGAHAGNATGHPAERRDSVAGRRPGR